MTFIVDDLLIRPFVGLLDILHQMAIEEAYDVEPIQDELKENRLLYELGDRSEADYVERKEELETRLEEAQAIRDQLQGKARVIN